MTFLQRILRHAGFIVIVLLIGLVATFQKIHDDLSPPFTTKLALAKRNLLPPTILPYITFGFTNIITDLYWIRAIQDFVAWNGKEGFYIGYFRNIATLDPRFEYPYLFSILTIPLNKDVETLSSVAEIADKGIQAIPTSWKIPFYLGTQYFLFTKKLDPAQKYLALAASKDDAPSGASLVYASLIVNKGTKKNTYTTSHDLVSVIYNNTDNEMIKQLAGKGIEENVITQALEKGILAYKVQYKRYPTTINELLETHLVSLPQELLENFVIEINKSNGSFRILQKKED
jgi:hypothetical protein